MAHYIDADRLRAEIERRHIYQKEMYNKTKPDDRPNDGWAESLAIMGELEELRTFIDSLQQEQLPGIEEHGVPGRDFIPVEWVDACEKYGKWKIIKQEQPSLPDNLDEAAREIVIKMHPCMEDCTILGDRLTRGQLMALVKAGVEWMANR